MRLEDIYKEFSLESVLEFKRGFERILVGIPDDVEDDIREVVRPLDVQGTDSFVFDFLAVKLRPTDRNAAANEKQSDDFC